MKKLLETIRELKQSEVKNLVNNRINEFKQNNKTFEELCFCILTANFDAEKCIKIQSRIGDGFLVLNENELQNKLKELGCRFHNRASYIVEARKHKDSLKDILNNSNTDNEKREWLVKNVKGLGYKEASHFLRNIGYENFAIIDFHILDLLAKNKLIEKPKAINKAKYLEIEKILKDIAKKARLNLAELDLYLWYLETGKVLK